MILEAIVTTTNEDGSTNIAPMGPLVGQSLDQFELKPFQSSATFQNLKRNRAGCLNITDDVKLFAMAVVHKPIDAKLVAADEVVANYLATAARAYEFETVFIDDREPRTTIKCRTRKTHRIRDLFGFNRAKHAVIEAAILISRIDFLPIEHVKAQLINLRSAVEKTGGHSEREAFAMLLEFAQSPTSPEQ